ncbi:MAG: hypothetical protein EA385_07850 [Salinarimonadaceae bacterium]|nr:MAG: hypothetical protein EA385_07850 [Salinarimonadaceae bacterium]
MTRHSFAVAALFLATLWPGGGAASFAVADPRFSTHYDASSRTASGVIDGGQVRRAALVNGALYLSLAIVGGPATLERLAERDSLSLTGTIWCDGRRTDTVVEFGMSPMNWRRDRESLRARVVREGFFTWRTYMLTTQLHCSMIEVILRDERQRGVPRIGEASGHVATIWLVD